MLVNHSYSFMAVAWTSDHMVRCLELLHWQTAPRVSHFSASLIPGGKCSTQWWLVSQEASDGKVALHSDWWCSLPWKPWHSRPMANSCTKGSERDLAQVVTQQQVRRSLYREETLCVTENQVLVRRDVFRLVMGNNIRKISWYCGIVNTSSQLFQYRDAVVVLKLSLWSTK